MDLNRDQIIDLLDDLGQEMQSRGQRAELFVVGGAAMALAFDARRATRDIDAVFVPKVAVYEAAAAVAACRGLAPTGSTMRSRGSSSARIPIAGRCSNPRGAR